MNVISHCASHLRLRSFQLHSLQLQPQLQLQLPQDDGVDSRIGGSTRELKTIRTSTAKGKKGANPKSTFFFVPLPVIIRSVSLSNPSLLGAPPFIHPNPIPPQRRNKKQAPKFPRRPPIRRRGPGPKRTSNHHHSFIALFFQLSYAFAHSTHAGNLPSPSYEYRYRTRASTLQPMRLCRLV